MRISRSKDMYIMTPLAQVTMIFIVFAYSMMIRSHTRSIYTMDGCGIGSTARFHKEIFRTYLKNSREFLFLHENLFSRTKTTIRFNNHSTFISFISRSLMSNFSALKISFPVYFAHS